MKYVLVSGGELRFNHQTTNGVVASNLLLPYAGVISGIGKGVIGRAQGRIKHVGPRLTHTRVYVISIFYGPSTQDDWFEDMYSSSCSRGRGGFVSLTALTDALCTSLPSRLTHT